MNGFRHGGWIVLALLGCGEDGPNLDLDPIRDARIAGDSGSQPDPGSDAARDAGSTDIGRSDGRDAAPSPCRPPGDYLGVVRVDGLEHRYRVHVPPQRIRPAPLVVQLHGGGSTGRAMEFVSRLTAQADTEGFVVVTPEGWPARGVGPQLWNAGACCGPVAEAPDHVAAIDAILDQVIAQDACIDSGRLFATGHSNGGMMAYRLACELSRRMAAVAVSGGSLTNRDLETEPPTTLFECSPSEPVSILHVHGLEDLCAPYDGGITGAGTGVPIPPVEDVIATWRDINDCGSGDDDADGPVRRRSWSCRGGTRVELLTVEGLGHAWAGSDIYGNPELCGGSTTDAVSTTEELWRFFEAAPER